MRKFLQRPNQRTNNQPTLQSNINTMKINASEKVLNLKGEAFKNGTEDVMVGNVIADILSVSKAGGKMKMYALAQKFFQGGDVEIDAADMALVKNAVESTEGYSNVVLGFILTFLGDCQAKESASKAK